MISFVWTPSSFWEKPLPVIPGNGGTETFTLGQLRELGRCGVDAQIITFRMGKNDGREFSPDVSFVDYPQSTDLACLEGEVLLVSEPLRIPTKKVPHMILHNPPYITQTKQFYKQHFKGHKLITNSQASASLWADYLGIGQNSLGVMYPFADAAFGKVVPKERPTDKVRVLFAGRLTPDKGFYTLLEALHFFADDRDIEFTVVLVGDQDKEFLLVEPLVRAHPLLQAVPARRTAQDMAQLLSEYDVVVMPSHSVLWKESFGILSVEAQHAGCQVVASNLGGLPETDCGGLTLFEPDNPVALAAAIREAAAKGRLSESQRKKASMRFTVEQSVDSLLALLKADLPVYQP
ncbi:MAG TPA: glycosyltransferase family 4 protein [Candidatus Saccharimonadales bacterium]|nr:glycosyltransferase family 4 protein [Candidatus Saccharimonadales bacterium]